jgi:hypothetical protein
MDMFNKMKLMPVIGLFTALSIQIQAQIQNEDVFEYPGVNDQNYRYNIRIPSIDGYQLLKCDFHIHSVFSDGQTWPDTRVNEAWNQGLDAIAMTDHIEYRRYKSLLISDFNKSNEIAMKRGEEIGLIVIPGSEITRKKPLGHLNALFIRDANKLEVENEIDAVNEAVAQGAFVIWNHPGWPNDTSTLYPVHQELIKSKKIHGAEVFNGEEQYPKVMDWCNADNLTWFSNSDLHYTGSGAYRDKLRRPMTLVFVKERSAEGIREALFAGRTLACFDNCLAGKEEFIREIVSKSIEVKVVNSQRNTVELSNSSDIAFQIKFGNYMYSKPVYANQVLRIDIPSGTEVTFTNCFTGNNRFFTTKLW